MTGVRTGGGRTAMVRRRAIVLALALIGSMAPAGGAMAAPAGMAATTGGLTLGAAAAARGKYFGVAVHTSKWNDPVYTAIVDREFGSLTPENAMFWDAIEPTRNTFSFTLADQIVNRARANGQRVRGYPLVYPSASVTPWLPNVPASEMRTAMVNHISTIVSRYRGQVESWDVVNEAFVDGSGLRRSTQFQRALGDSYIEVAFHAARAADPTAKLCYTDYNIEDRTAAKSLAVYQLIRDFKARGVPIDCVGLQSHFVPSTTPVPANFRQTLEWYGALGIEVHLTQLDIGTSVPASAQAVQYSQVVTAYMSVARCAGITVWGVRDSDSWRGNMAPLLFDSNGNKKPSYHAALSAMGGCGGWAASRR